MTLNWDLIETNIWVNSIQQVSASQGTTPIWSHFSQFFIKSCEHVQLNLIRTIGPVQKLANFQIQPGLHLEQPIGYLESREGRDRNCLVTEAVG